MVTRKYSDIKTRMVKKNKQGDVISFIDREYDMNGEVWEFDEMALVLNEDDHGIVKIIDRHGNTKKINKLQIKRRINERS